MLEAVTLLADLYPSAWHYHDVGGHRGREGTQSGPPSPRTNPSFSPLARGGGARPLPGTPAQTVERDWRQAMPRAEPALSLALRAASGPPYLILQRNVELSTANIRRLGLHKTAVHRLDAANLAL